MDYLLIFYLTCQFTLHDVHCIAAKGHFTVRYDNRDVGHSATDDAIHILDHFGIAYADVLLKRLKNHKNHVMVKTYQLLGFLEVEL